MQRISSNKNSQGKHGRYNAVDISARPDPDWYAPEDCTVTIIHNKDDNKCGKYIKLSGRTGLHTVCHNEKFYVKVGQKLKRGQKVAKMGYTGYTIPDGPAGRHAHWVLKISGVYTYPPSKVNQKFIKYKEEEVKKPTRAEIKRAWNTLLKEEPSERNYKGYGAKDISWMWHDIAQNLRKRLDKAQDSDSKVKSIKNKIVDFVNKVKP